MEEFLLKGMVPQGEHTSNLRSRCSDELQAPWPKATPSHAKCKSTQFERGTWAEEQGEQTHRTPEKKSYPSWNLQNGSNLTAATQEPFQHLTAIKISLTCFFLSRLRTLPPTTEPFQVCSAIMSSITFQPPSPAARLQAATGGAG